MFMPIMDYEPMYGILVQPTGLCQCADECVGIAVPFDA